MRQRRGEDLPQTDLQELDHATDDRRHQEPVPVSQPPDGGRNRHSFTVCTGGRSVPNFAISFLIVACTKFIEEYLKFGKNRLNIERGMAHGRFRIHDDCDVILLENRS